MAVRNRSTLLIGDLARRTGVPVKTIRFYSDQGLLPPATVTEAGYRRYAENDVVRLETIRTLRAVGFEIATIRQILDRNLKPDDAIRIQIEAISVQERTLRRRRLLLERALERHDVLGHPERGRALALLSTAERSAFLRNQLESGVEDVPVDDAWWTGFLKAAADDIPEELEDDQLTSWIELVDMTSDPTFAEAIRRTAEPFWSDMVSSGTISFDVWQAQQDAFVDAARRAVRDAVEPDAAAAMQIIGAWAAGLSRLMGDDGRAREIVEHMLQTHDPRLTRYWKLIATVKRMPYDQELQDAWEWIITALGAWLDDGVARH